MSQENVELARRAFEAWNRGDGDAFLQTLDSNVEVYLPEGGLNVGVRRGHEEIRRLIEGFLEVWDDLRMEPERFFEMAIRSWSSFMFAEQEKEVVWRWRHVPHISRRCELASWYDW